MTHIRLTRRLAYGPLAEPALAATAATALAFRWVNAGGHHTCGVTLDDRA